MSIESVKAYINIVEAGSSTTGKAKIWHVVNRRDANDVPGIIRWHGPWRKYVFETGPSFYDWDCLRMIANFCEVATKEHLGRDLEA